MNSPEESTKSEGTQRVPAPSISLPKDGGAIRGIGEKFAASYFEKNGQPVRDS